MNDVDVTEELLNGLGAKVKDLDLTDEESAVLDAVMWRAASVGTEVEGFAVKNGQPMGFVFESSTELHDGRVGGAMWAKALGFALPEMRVSVDPVTDTPQR